QAEDGIRYFHVTGVETCALPILVGFSSDFNTSSIDLKCCSLGFKASTISSNPPTTESIFKNESKEITPFCSNFLNVDNGTLALRSEERRVVKNYIASW